MIDSLQHITGGLHGRLPIVTQWVYLADDSCHHVLEAGQEMMPVQQQQPWLLAIKVRGWFIFIHCNG